MGNQTTLNKQEPLDQELIGLNKKAWELNRSAPKKSIHLANQALNLAIAQGKDYDIAISQFIIGTTQIWISNYEDSLKNLHDAILYFESNDKSIDLAKCYYSLGSCYYYLADFEESLESFFECLNIYIDLKNHVGQAEAYNGIGSVYYEVKNYNESLKTLQKSCDILVDHEDDTILAKVLHGLGETTYRLGNLKKSESYYKHCIRLCNLYGYDQVYTFANEGLANIYFDKKEEQGLEFYHIDNAIKMARKIEFKIGLAKCLLLKGKYYLQSNSEKSAFIYFNEAMELANSIENIDVICSFHKILSGYYERHGNFNSSLDHLKKYHTFLEKLDSRKHSLHLKSLQIKINLEKVEKENRNFRLKNNELKYKTEFLKESNQRIQTIAELGQVIASKLNLEDLLNEIYEQINTLMNADTLYIGLYDSKNELINFPFYIRDNVRIKDIVVPMKHTGKFTVWCIKNDSELVLNDFDNEASEFITLIDSQKNDIPPNSIIIIPIKIKNEIKGVLGVHSSKKNSYPQDKVDILKAMGAYISIALQNAKNHKKVTDLYGILENKNKKIFDSISYAQKLQNAILPTSEQMDNLFKNNFIILKPKEVIGGDFYWTEKIRNISYFAVANCTGSGVPGAFISVICHNALNRSLIEFGLREPKAILDKTRELVIKSFSKSGSEVKDGMDISLCTINDNVITFAGANMPLWIVRKSELVSNDMKINESTMALNKFSIIEYKGDNQSISYSKDLVPFTQLEVDLIKGDIIYLFSNGFGEDFTTKNTLKTLLLNQQSNPIKEQKDSINSSFEKWRKELDQSDDTCLLAIEI